MDEEGLLWEDDLPEQEAEVEGEEQLDLEEAAFDPNNDDVSPECDAGDDPEVDWVEEPVVMPMDTEDVAKAPPKNADFFLALRLVYGSATGKDVAQATESRDA